jgi:Rrf2 family protein
MIRLSTKGRYGTRLMLNLAANYLEGNKAVILKRISEEEEISIRYLEQIIIPLKIKRLVKSIRGASGGYTLARPPAEIKLSEILESLEGSFSLVECVEDDEYCKRFPNCPTHQVWKEASIILKDYFDNKSLKDLIKISKKIRTESKN